MGGNGGVVFEDVVDEEGLVSSRIRIELGGC